MKAKSVSGVVGLSTLFLFVALASQRASGVEEPGSNGASQVEQNIKGETSRELSPQEQTKSRALASARAQLALLEIQKRQLKEQAQELIDELEEQTGGQIKQLNLQAEEQIKQLKQQIADQVKQLKQQTARQIKQWKAHAQRQSEILEAQEELVRAQTGMPARPKGQGQRLLEPLTGKVRAMLSPVEIQQVKARISSAASSSVDAKLDKILERLDQFEKRLDHLEKRR